MVMEIKLTRGQVALIDDEDIERELAGVIALLVGLAMIWLTERCKGKEV